MVGDGTRLAKSTPLWCTHQRLIERVSGQWVEIGGAVITNAQEVFQWYHKNAKWWNGEEAEKIKELTKRFLVESIFCDGDEMEAGFERLLVVMMKK